MMELRSMESVAGVGKASNSPATAKFLSDFDCRDKRVEMRFDNLQYKVSLGFGKGEKRVLRDICGRFLPGQLTAIMGPSGSGKSTTLDILSGYRTSGVSGSVLCNGRRRLMDQFRRISCYIQQDDRLQPLLTMKENMDITTDLKLGNTVSPARKRQLVDEILSALGLLECQNTRCAQLSGGQRKRLSIALELINNPLVMFLDEPTTGLDSLSCGQCIALLRMLAQQGRTIVCTIHQPSASLFQLFDQVYLLARGQCLYQGTTNNLLTYLNDLHLPCPMYHNPADYIIEIASGEYGEDKIDLMIEGIDNGNNLDWLADETNNLLQPDLVGGIRRQSGTLAHVGGSANSSQFYQLKVLLARGWIKLKRDQTLTHMRIAVNLVVSLMLGMTYANAGNDANKIFDNYNLLFSLIMHHVMSSMMLNILTFPIEMNILVKEHFNRWYSIKAYYISSTILDIPITAFSCIMFTTIVYLLTNQIFEWHRFGLFMGTSLALVFISQSIGYMFGAVFDVVNGTFAGPIFMIPLMMFSGFGVNLRDLPSYLQWGTHVSFFRYALEGYVESIYGFDRPHLNCDMSVAFYCHYDDPDNFLDSIAMKNIDLQRSAIALGITLVATRVVAYFIVVWKVRYGR